MQQQQLAAQLAHHGGSARQPPLSPTPSDSDSDISLGAHSPPISSPGALRFGRTSPTPISSFRFGPHSPGPMPPQYRFGNHTSPTFRLERQSPSQPNYRLDRNLMSSPDSDPSNSYHTAVNLRINHNESPLNVDTTDNTSPVRTDASPSQTTLHSPPPLNLRIPDSDPVSSENGMVKIENPLPLRLSAPLPLNTTPHLSTPLRIHVSTSSRVLHSPSPINTHLGLRTMHGGIVRIAPPSPSCVPPNLHRPFSPARLT
ncbi:hypothetical protein WA026_004072 [Henosepilachna vigintioctopunctata]|uniref:Uncharacterized protein n=1 Tax=Henosepilachna vigintioctopunctata TaxID=420089 RepID=A0AAW1UHN3_9CUCU